MHIPHKAESGGDVPARPRFVNPPMSRRLRKLARKKNLPLAISILSLAISALTYLDQTNANRATAIANEETYAARVGFWVVSSGKRGQLPAVEINNGSALPISNVRVLLMAIRDPQIKPPAVDLYAFTGNEEYPVPPCKTLLVPIEQEAMSHILAEKGVTYKLIIQSIEFTDASGLTWNRSGDGTLTQISGEQSGYWQSLTTPIPSGVDMGNSPSCG